MKLEFLTENELNILNFIDTVNVGNFLEINRKI